MGPTDFHILWEGLSRGSEPTEGGGARVQSELSKTLRKKKERGWFLAPFTLRTATIVTPGRTGAQDTDASLSRAFGMNFFVLSLSNHGMFFIVFSFFY